MDKLKNTIKDLGRIILFFIPPIFVLICREILQFVKNRPRWKTEITSFKKNFDNLVILGNGPSLSDSLKNIDNLSCKYDVIAVNGFAATEQFTKIRPNMYLLADPAYFSNREEMQESTVRLARSVENALATKTQWKLELFIPSYAESSRLATTVRANSNIHIRMYNMEDTIIPINEKHRFALWDRNINAFLGQTVLNTCINLGIALRYNEIYLVGADTSWHETLRVDQDTNEVYTIEKHFYGTEKKYLFEDTYERIPVKLHSELRSIGNALSSYWVLRKYAESRGVEIYNASAYSNIDAYNRKRI